MAFKCFATMKYLVIYLFFKLWIVLGVEKITYISVEHPSVTYIDNKKFMYLNLTSKRFGRDNPVYYVDLSMTTMMPWDNNVGVDFYFYEFLSNVYKRSFVEMHFKWCDLVHKDIFFGPALRQQPCFKGPCPHPPGEYHLKNMSIPPASIPSSFPFRKGRILANISHYKVVVASGYVDMEIKEFKKKNDKITFSKV